MVLVDERKKEKKYEVGKKKWWELLGKLKGREWGLIWFKCFVLGMMKFDDIE